MLLSKANKQYEETKETILAVARTVGGKDLADKVSLNFFFFIISNANFIGC